MKMSITQKYPPFKFKIVSVHKVYEALISFKTSKARGDDEITTFLLKEMNPKYFTFQAPQTSAKWGAYYAPPGIWKAPNRPVCIGLRVIWMKYNINLK